MSACSLTCKSPTGDLMSTCFSPSAPLSLALMLQAGSRHRAAISAPRHSLAARLWLNILHIRLNMGGTSWNGPGRAFQALAACCDTRNRNRQVAADPDFAKDRLNGGCFGHRGVGEGANIILDCGEIPHQIRIAHGNYHAAPDGALEDRRQ